MEQIIDFLKKINHGYDGLIRSIDIYSFKNAMIIISTQDVETNKWINVKFTLNTLRELRVFQKNRTTNEVLTYGIRIKKIDEHYFIDFSPYLDIVESIDDFRKSDVYFCCVDLKWEIKEYADS